MVFILKVRRFNCSAGQRVKFKDPNEWMIGKGRVGKALWNPILGTEKQGN